MHKKLEKIKETILEQIEAKKKISEIKNTFLFGDLKEKKLVQTPPIPKLEEDRLIPLVQMTCLAFDTNKKETSFFIHFESINENRFMIEIQHNGTLLLEEYEFIQDKLSKITSGTSESIMKSPLYNIFNKSIK